MFCPLCHAEYRQGFTVCATCRAALVAADAPESERTPPRLKWETHDQRASDAVFSKLYEVGIPCLEKAHADFFSVRIGSISIVRRPTITLYVLQRDAAAAQQAAGVEFVPDRPAVEIPEGAPVQDCPYCAAKFPAGNSLCPACGGDLLEWQPGSESASAPPSGSDVSGPTAVSAIDGGEAQLVWRGDDPVAFSRAIEALKERGIRAHTLSTSDHLAFELAMPRPKFEILVPRAQSEKARELTAEFAQTLPLVPQEPTPNGADSNAGAVRLEVHDPSAMNEALAEGDFFKLQAGYERRRRQLQLGAGLYLFGLFLCGWVSGSIAGIRFFQFAALRHPFGDIRMIALIVLLAATIGCIAGALWNLFRAWEWKADKIGLLALFFGLQCFFLFSYLAVLASI
jgi:hypothetical protein